MLSVRASSVKIARPEAAPYVVYATQLEPDISLLPSLTFRMSATSSLGVVASLAHSWYLNCLRYVRLETTENGIRLCFVVLDGDIPTPQCLFLERKRDSLDIQAWVEGSERHFSHEFAMELAHCAMFTQVLPVARPAAAYNATYTVDEDGTEIWQWDNVGDIMPTAKVLRVTRDRHGIRRGTALVWGTDWHALAMWLPDWYIQALEK